MLITMACPYYKSFVAMIVIVIFISPCSNPHFLLAPDNASHTHHSMRHLCTRSIHNFVTFSYSSRRRLFLTRYGLDRTYPLIYL